MLDSDIVYGKIGIIQRCLKRIKDVTSLDPAKLDEIDCQDVFVLNLQRAVQAALDLAAHIIAAEGFGMPRELKEHFRFLREQGIIGKDISQRMEKMVGFRNIAVHEYEKLDTEVLKHILTIHLKDLEEFYSEILSYYKLEGN